jgi:hypothetical protein
MFVPFPLEIRLRIVYSCPCGDVVTEPLPEFITLPSEEETLRRLLSNRVNITSTLNLLYIALHVSTDIGHHQVLVETAVLPFCGANIRCVVPSMRGAGCLFLLVCVSSVHLMMTNVGRNM